jgi:hypothetical protein
MMEAAELEEQDSQLHVRGEGGRIHGVGGEDVGEDRGGGTSEDADGQMLEDLTDIEGREPKELYKSYNV